MDPVANPFSPGAGSRPPELAGREDIIANAEIGLKRVIRGKSAQSQIFLGLRGTGKTVLLNEVMEIGEREGMLYYLKALRARVRTPWARLDLRSRFWTINIPPSCDLPGSVKIWRPLGRAHIALT